MRKYLHRTAFLLATFLCFSGDGFATHLMGGNLAYEFIADLGGGNVRYRIVFKSYLNCDSPFWLNGFPDPTMHVGVYEGVASPPPSNLTYVMDFFMPLIDSIPIVPDVPDSCTGGQNPCIYQIIYVDTIDLPVSFDGYHIKIEDYARNGSIVNLFDPGGTGFAYHAYIPPTIIQNSSPIFSDLPVPFICVNDTNGIINTAFDPDGDQLLFSFVDPYGGILNYDLTPGPPANMPWPFPLVTWAVGGYDVNNPFGPGGYAYINAFTGYSEYMSLNLGNHVVAVEIKEYRNNNLIGITRRDLQLLIINCPVNPPPIFNDPNQQPVYTLEEGDSICFSIEYYDVGGDSLLMIATGPVFDSTLVNPPATITDSVIGDSMVVTTFCWNTACGQGQALPYIFTMEATDDGCPPKTTPIVFSIFVDPFEGPTQINGPIVVCNGQTGAIYWVDTIAGATAYTWTVTGGTIVSGQGSDSIVVDWGPGPMGDVSVITTSQFGCDDGPINLTVFITVVPADAGPDSILCVGDTVVLGGLPTGPPGSSYLWTPAVSLDDDTIANPTATPTGTTTYYVTVTDGNGCTNIDTVVVLVGGTNITGGPDVAICTGDSVQLNASGGSTYLWTPSTGLSNDTIPDPWASPGATTTYTVTISDTFDCIVVDTVTVSVNADPVVDAGPDTSLCLGGTMVIGGTPTGPAGSSYQWTPNTFLDDDTIANPASTPTATITYVVVVNDSNGCLGTDTVTITVNPLPSADAGSDTLICNSDTVQLFASGGVSYSWSPTTGLSNPNIANPLAFPSVTTTYTVTVTDNNGCTDTDFITITVGNPLANAGIDASFCLGDSVQLNASGGTSYSWSPTTGLSNPNIANPWASPSITTVYTVTVSDINGCSNSDSVTVTVNALPLVDAGPDTILCEGDSVVIGGSPTGPAGATYLWSPNFDLDNPTLANPTSTPSGSITYIVTVSDTNTCNNTDTMNIVVNPLPIADAGVDTSFCAGDSVQLNASGGVIYSWSPTTGLDNPNISNPWATPGTTTTYTVTVTNVNGCEDVDSVTIDVLPLPVVDAGLDVWICPGDSIQLSASGGSVYSWSPIAGLDNPNIPNPMASPAITTTYYVTVDDTNGCANLDSITVFVNASVPTDAGNDPTICVGDSVQIGGSPTSPNGTTYNWTPVAGLDNPNSPNPNASPAVTTTYYVYSTNDTCDGLDSVTVFVNPLPAANAGADVQVCTSDSVQLNASGGLFYVWTPADSISNDTIANPWVWPSDTTIYYVTVTDSNGCVNIDSVVVLINPTPIVDAGSDVAICSVDSTQLNASGGVVYSWSPVAGLDNPNISDPWASPIGTTTYYVSVIDSNGCMNIDSVTVTINPLLVVSAGSDVAICYGDSTQLNASGGVLYVWSPIDSLSNDSISNPWGWPTDTTTYIVTVEDLNGCTNTDTVTVFVNPLPIIDAGIDNEICLGSSTQLNATGGSTYLWSPATGLDNPNISNPNANPVDTITYYVYGTDSNGCSNIDSVTIIVNPLPLADAGLDTIACSATAVIIGGLPTGPSGSTYSWSPGGSLNDSTLANPTANPTTTTTYIVTIIDTNGCMNTDTTMISIFSITSSDDTSQCLGDSTQLIVTTLSGLSPYNYQWSPVLGLSDTSSANPFANPPATTTYSVTVTDGNGCAETVDITVIINDPPTSGFTFTLTPSCEGLLAEFENLTMGATTYAWDFGNGETSNEENPTHEFAYEELMNVTLVASGNMKCSDSTNISEDVLTFDDYYTIDVPNVFTPNGDGVNDWFEIDSEHRLQECMELKIYNRWGNLMFTSTGNSHSWNGRSFAGKKAPDGVYFYIFNIRQYEFNGTVTLMR